MAGMLGRIWNAAKEGAKTGYNDYANFDRQANAMGQDAGGAKGAAVLQKERNAERKKAKLEETQAQATGDPQKIKEAQANTDQAEKKAEEVESGQTTDNIDNTSTNNTDNTDNTSTNNTDNTDNTSTNNTDNTDNTSTKNNSNTNTNNNSNSNNIKTGTQIGGNVNSNYGKGISATLARDVGAALHGTPWGNKIDVQAVTAAEQMGNKEQRAGQRQMEAQAHQQIADQNVYGEADKEALAKNDSENRQNVRKAGVLGAGAALARSANSPDIQSAKARSDAQRSAAEVQREKSNQAQEEATMQGGWSKQLQVESRDYDTDLNEESRLSEGEGGSDEQQPETEEPKQQPEPEDVKPEQFNANWQNVMNYMTYGNDPTSGWNPNSSQPPKPGREEAMNYVNAKGWQPLSQADVEGTSKGFDSPTGELQQVMSKARGGFMKEWSEKSGRVSEEGQINKGDTGYEEVAKANTETVNKVKDPPSDVRVKDVIQELSDERMKWIKEDFDRDGTCSREDFDWLLSRLGNKFEHEGREYDNQVDDGWDDTVLRAYADHIKNYVYMYKPEATQIDSSIDPNQEHIGPMAQDIEQVNPACVNETPEGVKTVDTARLAMMNAGAIGDLARQLQVLTDKLKALGV